MVYLLTSLVCFVAALVAGYFGFAQNHVAAQILFFLFLVLYAASLIFGLVSRR